MGDVGQSLSLVGMLAKVSAEAAKGQPNTKSTPEIATPAGEQSLATLSARSDNVSGMLTGEDEFLEILKRDRGICWVIAWKHRRQRNSSTKMFQHRCHCSNRIIFNGLWRFCWSNRIYWQRLNCRILLQSIRHNE